MNYELAKKLKNAGFPQKGLFWWLESKPLSFNGEVITYYTHSTNNGECRSTIPYDVDGHSGLVNVNKGYLAPTLEELIDACGDELMLTNECGEWEAWKGSESEMVRMGEAGAKFEVTGKTPTEAVANLWIKINK